MAELDEEAVISDDEEETKSQIGQNLKEQICYLTQEHINEGLSVLCKTGNGLGHAFVKLEIKEKGLNDISAISRLIHLRFVDVSNNLLRDLSPLASLTQLLWLKADHNNVASIKGQPFALLTYLQWLSMALNSLTELDGLVGPALESLNVTGNNIHRLNLQNVAFPNLVTLELRGNKMDTIDCINLPNLRRLFLAQNRLKNLNGLGKLERLTTLHLRDNHLDSLEGLSSNMKCLQYLNVRGNAILEEKALQCLKLVSKTLRALIISENPVVETTDYRLSLLILLPQLERVDKDAVTPEEKAEAQERIKEFKEQERDEPKIV